MITQAGAYTPPIWYTHLLRMRRDWTSAQDRQLLPETARACNENNHENRKNRCAVHRCAVVLFVPSKRRRRRRLGLDSGALWLGGDIGIDVETRVPPIVGEATDTSFGDILEKLDGAFQIHIEGQGDRFGAFADFTYVGLSDSNELPALAYRIRSRHRLFEIAGVWSPGEERFPRRGCVCRTALHRRGPHPELTPVNPLLPGVKRGQQRLLLRLHARRALHMGAVGALGPDAARRRFVRRHRGHLERQRHREYRTRTGAWFFGYRYLDVEIDKGNATTNITMSGPGVGYGFRF